MWSFHSSGSPQLCEIQPSTPVLLGKTIGHVANQANVVRQEAAVGEMEEKLMWDQSSLLHPAPQQMLGVLCVSRGKSTQSPFPGAENIVGNSG